MAQPKSPRRVLVCGTTFGQVYLEALRAPADSFELAGILAQGSERSRACAEHYGVPLFTEVEHLPSGIDIACVVVRSMLLGGRGTALAHRLMERGIHVLQEHPLHHDELAECLRTARRYAVHYHVNSFYTQLPSVRGFIRAAQVLLRLRRPVYIDAACSFQVAHALLDILGAVVGKLRPWGFAATSVSPAVRALAAGPLPFRSLDGLFGGVPISLRVQNQLHVDAPDDQSHLLHRISLGTEAGELTLVTTHGPVIWCARPDIPREVRDATSRHMFAQGAVADDCAYSVLMGARKEVSQGRLFRSVWPEAVRRALMELRQAVHNGDDPLRRGQYHLSLCRVWQDIACGLDAPQLLRGVSPHRCLSVEELGSVESAAAAIVSPPVELDAGPG